ncbi:MAG: hypothetical protein ACK5PI_00615 [Acetobacteraceae bacterium]
MVAVPVPGLPQAPAVQDVADEEQPLALRPMEEIGGEIGAAGPRAEMDVLQEHGPVAASRG